MPNAPSPNVMAIRMPTKKTQPAVETSQLAAVVIIADAAASNSPRAPTRPNPNIVQRRPIRSASHAEESRPSRSPSDTTMNRAPIIWGLNLYPEPRMDWPQLWMTAEPRMKQNEPMVMMTSDLRYLLKMIE